MLKCASFVCAFPKHVYTTNPFPLTCWILCMQSIMSNWSAPGHDHSVAIKKWHFTLSNYPILLSADIYPKKKQNRYNLFFTLLCNKYCNNCRTKCLLTPFLPHEQCNRLVLGITTSYFVNSVPNQTFTNWFQLHNILLNVSLFVIFPF